MRRLSETGAIIVLAALFAAPAHAAGVDVELNRLEARGDDCRVQMVITNATSSAYKGFALDLVIFDAGGQIARRTALDVSPVRASKTTVYAFDLDGLACDAVGSILLNDVVDCDMGEGPLSDCVDSVTTRSRLKVSFKK
jgi:hypothetical protein